MKVLIVDGSKERRRVLAAALAEVTDIVVQGAVADVRSAVRAVGEAEPDVVVTGVTLPDGDGTYLIERMRRLSHVPSVVVCAGTTSVEQREHYLAAGADHYTAADPVSVRSAVLQLASSRPVAGSISAADAQQLLGRLTSGVVHDFNNYLHAVNVSLELIERRGPSAELLASARAGVQAMQRLNTALLAYARGGAPGVGAVNLGIVIEETLATLRRVIPPTVELEIDIAPGSRPVMGVRAELEQVVLNLVINAIDAMPDGGELEISLRPAPSQAVLLAVADTGRGLSPTAAEQPVASTKQSGAGLGLRIVRSVIGRHGGALQIVPRTSGGTVVAVMLPVARAA